MTKIIVAGTAMATILGTASIAGQTAKEIADKAGQSAERIADKAGQSAERIAILSKVGSAEEAETLKKTENLARAAALGSVIGASDAVKTRWWVSWPLSFWVSPPKPPTPS
jgi:hypothetical protein